MRLTFRQSLSKLTQTAIYTNQVLPGALVNILSKKNALITPVLCLSLVQAIACSSDSKQPPVTIKIAAQAAGVSAMSTTTRQDLYRATEISPTHLQTVKNKFAHDDKMYAHRCQQAVGHSKDSKIVCYAKNGRKSFTLGNGQLLCAQENIKHACPVTLLECPMASMTICAARCELHDSYTQIQPISPKKAEQI